MPEQREKWWRSIVDTSLLDPARAGRSISDLSLGQRRRGVNLRALQTCPRFIILDEPFIWTGPGDQKDMLDLLQKVVHDYGVGVFFISHDVEALQTVGERLWLLADGELSEYTG